MDDLYKIRVLCAGRWELVENGLSYREALSAAADLIMKYHAIEVLPDEQKSCWCDWCDDWMCSVTEK